MANAVTITEAPGSRYTWSSATFTWSSPSAGKNWSSAYPAVYTVVVAVTLALVEANAWQLVKRSSEGLELSDATIKRHELSKKESLGFAETYSDLIAYVLRWVESLAIAETSSWASEKRWSETLSGVDELSRRATKFSIEGFGVDDALQQAAIKRLSESVAVSEGVIRAVGKFAAEIMGLDDQHAWQLTVRITQALQLAETYTDLIAFILRISETISLGELVARQVRKPMSEAFATDDRVERSAIKRLAEAVVMAEALGRTVAYRRSLSEGLAVADALQRAMRITATEAIALAEQYRRHANGVISDMIVGSTEITEQDFASIVQAGHPPGYTDFRDFIAGDYTYQRALFRAILSSRNSDRGYIDALRLTVDVPDVFDRGSVQITDAAAGATIVFARRFRVPPEVTMTHKGGTTVAIPRLTGAVTTTGFTAVLENSTGTRLTGAFTWIAQGY